MGAEESVLKSVEVGESFLQIPSLSKIWSTVAPARYFQSQTATVFIKEFDEQDDLAEAKKFLECGIQTLKSLRHPRIVKYLDGSITSANACLIVERLRPLEYMLDDGFEKDEILSGLCDIFDSVLFLHEKAGLSHNNIGPVAVFVSPDGLWKLGSFECAQRLENNVHWCQTEFAKHAKDDNFIPPEDQQMMYSNVPVYARDVYGLGKLVDFLMPILQDVLEDDRKDEIAQLVERMTTDEAAKRPPLNEANWRHVFRNDLYDIGDFLRELPLKSVEQKTVFFQDLISKLERLSPRVVAKRLSKSLLSRFVLLEREAVEHFLPRFLAYEENDTGLLSAHLFKQYVVPELKKVFCVHETAIRLALLQYFDRYCLAFDEATLKDLILPELLLGMKDSDETIVAASMRCLADLVPLLGAEAVTGLKHTKYFCEGRPRLLPPSEMPDLSKLTSVKDAFSSSSTETSQSSKKSLRIASSSKEIKEEPRKPLLLESKTRTPLRLPTMNKPIDNAKPEPPSDPSPEAPSTPVATVPSPPEEDSYEETPDVDWVDWDADEPTGPQDIPVQSPTTTVDSPFITSTPVFPIASRQTSSKVEVRKASESKPLGAEFDVMALQITATPTAALEDDLFADMAPKITATRKKIEDETVVKPASSKFQASAPVDDQDAGWDDAQLWNTDEE